MTVPTTHPSPRVAAFLAKIKSSTRPARLILALDATGSRQDTWDRACTLQVGMAEEAAKLGAMDIQLVYFGGDRMHHTEWTSDPYTLVQQMRRIECSSGGTMIEQMLDHAQAENAREKVSAVIFVGDAVEESPIRLYKAAAGLNTPLFVFQEGQGICINEYGDRRRSDGGFVMVEQVFREVARVTGGAYGKFKSGSAKQLGELLKAVVVFAVGGRTALTNQNTEGARKLLSQLK